MESAMYPHRGHAMDVQEELLSPSRTAPLILESVRREN
jgi:hypothetical protein